MKVKDFAFIRNTDRSIYPMAESVFSSKTILSSRSEIIEYEYGKRSMAKLGDYVQNRFYHQIEKNNRTTAYIYINLDAIHSRAIDCRLIDFSTAVEKSRYILSLEDDWDDLGSPAYEHDVWKSAILFLLDYAQFVFDNFNKKVLLAPKIYHGPNGSIDFLWETENINMLMNFKKDFVFSFYAHNSTDTNKIQGSFNSSDFEFSLLPLLTK